MAARRLLVQIYSVGSKGIWNAPAWSIACEAFFYLSFPLIAAVLARLSSRVNLYLVMLGLGMVQMTLHIWSVQTGLTNSLPHPDFTYVSPFLRIWEFAIGCVLGLAFLQGRAGDQRYLLSARGRHLVLLGGGLGIGVAAVFKFLGQRGAQSWCRSC